MSTPFPIPTASSGTYPGNTVESASIGFVFGYGGPVQAIAPCYINGTLYSAPDIFNVSGVVLYDDNPFVPVYALVGIYTPDGLTAYTPYNFIAVPAVLRFAPAQLQANYFLFLGGILVNVPTVQPYTPPVYPPYLTAP